MNAEALRPTLESGQTWFWSRSRGAVASRGHQRQHPARIEVRYDATDALPLRRLRPGRPATPERSCLPVLI
jgi:phosphoribosyl-AMP cyclohydrolase